MIHIKTHRDNTTFWDDLGTWHSEVLTELYELEMLPVFRNLGLTPIRQGMQDIQQVLKDEIPVEMKYMSSFNAI